MSKSPPAESSCQRVIDATEALSRARDLLVRPTPQNLDIACVPLAKAVAEVREFQALSTTTPSSDVVAALAGLRKEIDLVSHMLETAAAYHVNLIQRMVQASNAAGPQVPHVEPARHLSLDA